MEVVGGGGGGGGAPRPTAPGGRPNRRSAEDFFEQFGFTSAGSGGGGGVGADNKMARGEGPSLDDLLRQFRNDAAARGMEVNYFRQMMSNPESGTLQRVAGTLAVAADFYLKWRDTQSADEQKRKKATPGSGL